MIDPEITASIHREYRDARSTYPPVGALAFARCLVSLRMHLAAMPEMRERVSWIYGSPESLEKFAHRCAHEALRKHDLKNYESPTHHRP